MCGARKSMLHVPLNIGEHNNLNDDVQTVKRRSRSRKPRNKRRNTIAGTDQKEIEEAVRGYVYSCYISFLSLRYILYCDFGIYGYASVHQFYALISRA